ncbi:MAG: hypothetical protein V4439_03485 [Patescibacteria group bacterium]
MPEGINREGDNKMTPQKMLEEIKKTYPTSRLFLQEIIDAGDRNWGTSKDPNDVRSIVVELAQHHRSIKSGQYTFDIKDQEEKEKKMYERGLWLASLVGAVYHGELTMISKDGKLLSTPESFK